MILIKLKRPAFTLLEILITLSMLVLILGSVYGAYAATIRSLAHSKPKHALQQQARIFMQRITSEIRCCYAGNRDKLPQTSLKNVRTRKKELLTQESASLFVGGEALSGQSFLRFVTSAVTSRRNHSLSGLAIIEYMLDESTNTILRSKRRYIGGLEDDDDNFNWIVVLENVHAIPVEYFDGKKWLEEWDSNDMKGLLPHAVRISLDLQSEDVVPLSVTFTAQIVCKSSWTSGVTIQKTATDAKDSLSKKSNAGSNDSKTKK